MRDAFVDIQHSGTLHGLMGTLGNLELRNVESRGVARLAFDDLGLAGLMGDVDVGHTSDVTKNGSVCANHLRRSL